MQIDKPTNRLRPCECGNQITHYTIGYSRSPYYVGYRCGKLTGGYQNLNDLVGAWNNAIPNDPKCF